MPKKSMNSHVLRKHYVEIGNIKISDGEFTKLMDERKISAKNGVIYSTKPWNTSSIRLTFDDILHLLKLNGLRSNCFKCNIAYENIYSQIKGIFIIIICCIIPIQKSARQISSLQTILKKNHRMHEFKFVHHFFFLVTLTFQNDIFGLIEGNNFVLIIICFTTRLNNYYVFKILCEWLFDSEFFRCSILS